MHEEFYKIRQDKMYLVFYPLMNKHSSFQYYNNIQILQFYYLHIFVQCCKCFARCLTYCPTYFILQIERLEQKIRRNEKDLAETSNQVSQRGEHISNAVLKNSTKTGHIVAKLIL